MELTEKQKDILKEIEFEFVLNNQNFDTDKRNAVPCMVIAKYNDPFYEKTRFLIQDNTSGLINTVSKVYESSMYQNDKIGQNFLFFNNESDDKVYSELKTIEKYSEKPFGTKNDNFYKYIELLS